MAHGTQDWFVTAQQSLVHKMADMGELAARLGSPDVYDRRGTVFFITSFESGFAGWSTGYSGTGGGVYYVCTPSKSGHGSIMLETGNGASAYAEIARHLPPPPYGVWGFEYAFAPDSEMLQTYLVVNNHVSQRQQTYGVGYDITTGNLWVYDENLSPKVIANVGKVYVVSSPFCILKVVFDSINRNYVRAIFNNIQVDISDTLGFDGAGGHDRDVEVVIYSMCKRGLSSKVAIDSVIFTTNE